MSCPAVVALLAAVVLLCSFTSADVPADLITDLPGYGKPPSAHYSGYLPADANETVFLHYWLVLSTNNPSTDPLAIWMNGGPGASSLEGFLTELGPFYLNGSTNSQGIPTLVDNPLAWTTVSSIIFLEQPIGVGFSYAKNGSVVSDDYTQSQNCYGWLLNFFKAYPELSKNDLFITGESYAGIYVPTLAERIVDGNAAGNPHINLKGIAVGDGCTGAKVGTCGDGPEVDAANTFIAVEQLHGHAMISQPAYDNVTALCGDWKQPSTDCLSAANRAIGSVGQFDIYDIYHQCYGTSTAGSRGPRSTARPPLRAPNQLLERVLPKDPYPCWIGTEFESYLMNSAVRKATHTEQTPHPFGGVDYTRNLPSLLPTYPKLISHMNVLIYSGDSDMCVPYLDSYNWTRSLGLPETQSWRPWSVEAEGRSWTGGFLTQWGKNFTFLTIKHAGHMVRQLTRTPHQPLHPSHTPFRHPLISPLPVPLHLESPPLSLAMGRVVGCLLTCAVVVVVLGVGHCVCCCVSGADGRARGCPHLLQGLPQGRSAQLTTSPVRGTTPRRAIEGKKGEAAPLSRAHAR